MPGSPIKSARDLIGKKVAITAPKSISEMLIIMALEASGVNPALVRRIALGGVGPALTALEKGAVQAAPIIDPLWSARKDRYTQLSTARDLLRPMTQSVGIATTDFIKDQPAVLRGIIAGRRRGVQSIYANPGEAAAIIAEAYDNLPLAIAQQAMADLIPLQHWSEGCFDIPAMDEMCRGLKIIGQLDENPDWSKLIGPSFLPADVRKGI